jgi:protein O-GlcNAc transferase
MVRLPLDLAPAGGPSVADMLREAAAHYQRGDAAGARRVLKLVLRKAPQHFDAVHLMGLVEAQRGHPKDAELLLRNAVRINPQSAEAQANRGNVLRELKRFDEALTSYDHALALRSDYPNALSGRGIVLVALGRFEEALASYDKALALAPSFIMARYNRALALARLGRHEGALADYDAVLALDPAFVQCHVDRANALAGAGRVDDALVAYNRAIALDPRFVPAHYNRGLALLQNNRFEEAIASFDALLALDTNVASAHDSRGNALLALGRLDDALAAFTAATKADPKFAGAHNNRGYVLMKLQRAAEALACFDKALAIDAGFGGALNNRGNVLLALGRIDDSLSSFGKAIANSQDPSDALANHGNAAMAARRFDVAVADFERLVSLKPDYPYALGNLFYCKMHICDWGAYEQTTSQILAALDQNKQIIVPFASIACVDSAAGQLSAAKTWAADVLPATSHVPPRRRDHDKIRIAYVSGNFRNDPLSVLTVELFERHDRNRFETFAISHGPADKSALRERLERAFDSFVDVVGKSDNEVAELMRSLEIDIAVDLNGFAENCRPGILAQRPAAVQVSHLNYLGTMGVPHIDYLLADRHSIGDDIRPFFSESIAYLPDTLVVADSTRRISDTPASRAEMGLPEDGVVFCCFNSTHKITPIFFDVWMRLLKKVDGSVLWFAGGSETGQRNLRREAVARGVAAERIVFMARVSDSETYLARYRLADLFLDTLPYNAITTAVDALWAGLPVLTCRGHTFAGRCAAGILQSAGLPELIADSLETYEAAALRLVQDRAALSRLRQKLIDERMSLPLFDTDRFRRNVESAYTAMWERHRRGEAPADFDVKPLN